MKSLQLQLLILVFVLFGINSQAQVFNSVNVNGSRLFGDNSTRLHKKPDGSFIAFGASANLSVQHFDFVEGVQSELFFTSNNPNLPGNQLQGAGGFAENDSTFVVIGQMEEVDKNAQVFVIKSSASGNIIWSRQLQTLYNDFADKIIQCENGDYLISVKSNLREDNFGGLIWGTAIFRIDPSGQLLWFKNLDNRSDNNSDVVGIFELVSGNIVVVQRFGEKIGFVKTDAEGEKIEALVSNENILPTSADYDSVSGNLWVCTENLGLISFDTLFSASGFYEYNHSNLASFNSVKVVNDSTLAVGGRFGNQAAILNINPQNGSVRMLYHNSFFPLAPSVVQGLFVLGDTFFSMISNGFAVNFHNSDLSHSCFNSIAGNQITVGSVSTPTFATHSFSELTQVLFTALGGINSGTDSEIQASVNCQNHDLSIRTQELLYTQSCRNVTLRWYIYNHGTSPVSSFRIRYYYNDTFFENTFNVNPIASKTGIFMDYGSLYLNSGESRVTYRVFDPNGNQDEFMTNDSFYVDFVTIPNVSIQIGGSDSVCEGQNNLITATGPDGLYGLEKDGNIVLQGPGKVFNYPGGGIYRMMYQNTQTCRFFSDTLQVTEFPSPAQPSLSTNNDTLFTDAANPVYWYFNNVLQDSNKSFFVYMGIGNYKVETVNSFGCFASNELLNLNLSLFANHATPDCFLFEKTLYWQGQGNALVEIYSISGQKIDSFSMNENSNQLLNVAGGFFLVVVRADGYLKTFKTFAE